ncbi:LysE family translocator [Psychromonas sp. PT13]|uniref:LysE family translocator n=1 Tax=Psychromonas sp. PT13 TaxID=3439547 RepID=UPI003EBD6FA8
MNHALLEIAPAIVLFCLITTFTPGPNNILLTHSAANFGIKKTLPHVLGIRIGMTLLHITILLGLGELFKHWPYLHLVFTYTAATYILYMSAKIAFAKPRQGSTVLKPMNVLQAASFQIINPKSWASLITISSAFTLSGDLFWPSAILGLLMFNLATLPGTFMWLTIGKLVAKKLQDPNFHRYFNLIMGTLLLSTIPMILLS